MRVMCVCVCVCTQVCVHNTTILRMSHKQTNSCFPLTFYFSLGDSVGFHGLQTQRGFVGMLNRSGCRKSKLDREKMGFLQTLGALDGKVNGFMSLQ